MEDKVMVDLQGYAQTVERQRNGAFNEAAMLATALDASRAEVERLAKENDELRAKLPPDAPKEEAAP